MSIGTSKTRGRRLRAALLSLAFVASGFTTLVWATPANAASCSLPTGVGTEQHTKQSVLNQASSSETVRWKAGNEITGAEFLDYLNNGTQVYQSNMAPDAIGYYRQNGDYSLPVDLKANGCKSIILIAASSGSQKYLDVCVAPSPGQIHVVCNWNLPDGLIGNIQVGLYNTSTEKMSLTSTHSPIIT
jgi:hypothetical protein